MENLIRKMGGRKVVFILLLVLAGLAVDLLTPRGLSESLKDLMTYLGGFFVAGNSASKIAGALGNKSAPYDQSNSNDWTAPLVEDSNDLEPRVETLEKMNTEVVNNIQIINQTLAQIVNNLRG